MHLEDRRTTLLLWRFKGKIIDKNIYYKKSFDLGIVQINSSKLKDKINLTVIKTISVKSENDLKQIESYSKADFLLFDYKSKKNELPGGNAKSFNWSILKDKNITKPWFISGGINKNNINELLKNLTPYGVDISSGVEDQPGIKSIKKIKEIVEIVNG